MSNFVQLILLVFLSLTITTNAQIRGPLNTTPAGVIDGVVIKDDAPFRDKVEYEHVRAADLVWSRRVYSRISAKEKINHDIFFPSDYFNMSWFTEPPKNKDEFFEHKGWVKHHERYSLWTIIMTHLLKGDLTLYRVSDEADFEFRNQDGYSFKYPLEKYTTISQQTGEILLDKDSYFNKDSKGGSVYQETIDKTIGIYSSAEAWAVGYLGNPTPMETNPEFTTFEAWIDWMISNDKNVYEEDDWTSELVPLKSDEGFKNAWTKAMSQSSTEKMPILKPSKTFYLTSEFISGYNIKEDWYFDKERSLLDRRIIAIAPLAYFVYDGKGQKDRRSSYGLIVRQPFTKDLFSADLNGEPIQGLNTNPKKEYELFWLYFPELRRVMINYYVFNDQNDSQWMTFDDLFWKRRFNSKIYKVSDKFDREIQDYKYGVDALYEAERLKEKIRNWEINVWNY